MSAGKFRLSAGGCQVKFFFKMGKEIRQPKVILPDDMRIEGD